MPDLLDIDIDTRALELFAGRTLPQIRAAMHVASRAMTNNMAFGVRLTALEWGIPQVMTVRNPNILRATLRVDKAVRALGNEEKATLGMTTKDRFGGLAEEELGGTMKRPTASLAARGGNVAKTIAQKARLKQGANFLTPDDIEVANDAGSTSQRIAAMISYLERQGGAQRPFIVHGHPALKAGLYMLGKRTPGGRHKNIRKLVTLRRFHGGTVEIKRRRWLRPSIDKWIATHSRAAEWERALTFALNRMKKG